MAAPCTAAMIGTGQAIWARIIASKTRCCAAHASSDPAPQVVATIQRRPRLEQFVAHLARERVGHVGPVEHDRHDARRRLFDQDRLGHQKLLGWPSTWVATWLRIRFVEIGATW